VQVLYGKAMDVVVDIRPHSKTFKQYCFNELSDDNQHQVFIPNGFIHGFYAVSERVVFHYKCSSPYNPALEFGYRYDDSSFSIPWPCENFIISDRDNNHPYFSESTLQVS
jgi:dTDP-4-dehydrorhamnose 3,5-epimerase